MFPTLKDKITNVERFCEDVGPGSSSFSQGASMRSRPKFLPALELEKIVKLETHNRNSKYSVLGGTEQHSEEQRRLHHPPSRSMPGGQHQRTGLLNRPARPL